MTKFLLLLYIALIASLIAYGQSTETTAAEQWGESIVTRGGGISQVEFTLDNGGLGALVVNTSAPRDVILFHLSRRGRGGQEETIFSSEQKNEHDFSGMSGGQYFLRMQSNPASGWQDPVRVQWKVTEPGSLVTAGLVKFQETVSDRNSPSATLVVERAYSSYITTATCRFSDGTIMLAQFNSFNSFNKEITCKPRSGFTGTVRIEARLMALGWNSNSFSQFRVVSADIRVVAARFRPIISVTGLLTTYFEKDPRTGQNVAVGIQIPITIRREDDNRSGGVQGYSTITARFRPVWSATAVEDLVLSLPIRFMGFHSEPLVASIETLKAYLRSTGNENSPLVFVGMGWSDDGEDAEAYWRPVNIQFLVPQPNVANSGIPSPSYGRLATEELRVNTPAIPPDLQRIHHVVIPENN